MSTSTPSRLAYGSHSIQPRWVKPPAETCHERVQSRLELQRGKMLPQTCALPAVKSDELGTRPPPPVLPVYIVPRAPPATWPKGVCVLAPGVGVAVRRVAVVADVRALGEEDGVA